MNKIPVVFTFNDTWARVPACVCIRSLLENAKPSTCYEIIVVSSDISEGNQQVLCRQVDLFKRHSIRFIRYALKNYSRPNELISPDGYTRYFLPDILKDYSRVIYADVDLIFQGDLSEVIRTDIGNNYLAAVLDIKANALILEKKWPGFDGSWFGTYFNSGFLLMNLDLMRIDRTPERIAKLAQDPNRNYRTNDQCIANKVFSPKVCYLPMKFNFLSRYLSHSEDKVLLDKLNITDAYFEAVAAACVIHYTWTKPWQARTMGYVDTWWRYAQKTPCYRQAQRIYLSSRIKNFFLLLKKFRQRLFQFRLKKDKRIVRFMGFTVIGEDV